MELRPPASTGKKLWNLLRVAFSLSKKSFISKRKLIMDLNLMLRRGRHVRKSFTNLIFHHRNHHRDRHSNSGIRDYEFSCSNSPDPVFFHLKRRCSYFPCIGEPSTPRLLVVPSMIEHPMEFSTEYSDEEEAEEEWSREEEVDDEAERFIEKFYEQLRAQRSISLLE